MKWKPFLFSLAAVVFLLITFIHPGTKHAWDTIDLAIFKTLNGMLENNKLLQLFWAIVNHKNMDLVEDLIFLLFFFLGLKETPRELRWKKTSQYIFIVLLASCVIFFVNRHVLRHHVIFPRPSPSLTVSPCVKITDEIPWRGLKDETLVSFPGDHATTLLFFGFLYSAFSSRRWSFWAWAYVIFRSLPRIVVGAHWFSDIAVGSISIALFFSSCFLYTPLGTLIINAIERARKIPYAIFKKPI